MSTEAEFYSFEPTLLAFDSSTGGGAHVDGTDNSDERRTRGPEGSRRRRRHAVINPERSVSKTFLTLLIWQDQKKETATCRGEVAM